MKSIKFLSIACLSFLVCLMANAQVNEPVTKGTLNNGPQKYYKSSDWLVGVAFGNTMVHGDVRPRLGLSLGILGEKQFNDFFSVKGDFTYGRARGSNWYMNGGIGSNPAWNGEYNPNADYTASGSDYGLIFTNFKSSFINLNVTASLGLKNLLDQWVSFSLGDKWGFDILLGTGLTHYKTKINALDENGQPYAFTSLTTEESITPDDKNLRSVIKGGLYNLYDKTYETTAEADKALIPVIVGGIEFKYHMSKLISIGIQTTLHKTFDDLLDGQQWTELNELTPKDDWVSFIRLKAMYNLSKRLDNPTKSTAKFFKKFKNKVFVRE